MIPAASAAELARYAPELRGLQGERWGRPVLVPGTRQDTAAVAECMRNPNPPMHDRDASPLSGRDVQAIAAYVRTPQGADTP